ncbi:MAG: UbiX family flavin prenyltransferase [Desulfatiglandales bacterium]
MELNKTNRIILGITGASAVIYGIEMLKELNKVGLEVHLIISDSGIKNIAIETKYSLEVIKSMAYRSYDNKDLAAPISSGSFLTEGMIIAPCTIKTLSGIANSYSDSLIVRAADVTLKEKRKLVLLVRETPLHKGHITLMGMAADMGASIMPPIPSFYHHPKTIDDIIHHAVGKVFDYFGIEHHLFERWGSKSE